MNVLIVLSLTGVASLFSGFFQSRKPLFVISITGLLAAFVLNIFEWNSSTPYFNNMLLVDNFSVAFTAVLIFSTLLIFILFFHYKEQIDVPLAEVFTLLLFSLTGAVMTLHPMKPPSNISLWALLLLPSCYLVLY